MIDKFEEWIKPRIDKGHFPIDVIAAYCRTFPCRTIGLITNLYAFYQLGKRDDDGRPTSEQVRRIQDAAGDHGESGS